MEIIREARCCSNLKLNSSYFPIYPAYCLDAVSVLDFLQNPGHRVGGFALFGVQDDFILVIFNHNNHKFGDLLINYLTSLGESLSLASLGSLGSGRHFLSLGSSTFQISNKT